MTFFEDGGLSRGASHWLSSLVALAVAGGLIAGVYASLRTQDGVLEERMRMIEARIQSLNSDHDLLQRIDVRLANIERALAERDAQRSRNP